MGDAAISALVKDVLGRLTSEVIKEFGLLWGFKNDILSLKEHFIQIQAVLEDAEEKHIRERAVESWLKSLRSASLEVENVLDEISTETLLQRLHKKRGVKYMVRAFFSSTHNKLMFHVRAAHKVKAIRMKLADIASKKSELSLTPSDVKSDVDDGVEGQMPNRETSSIIHDSLTIFGRDEEANMVIEKICNNDIEKYDDGELRVYGIWGMGGVGKTTLAQLVYNNERVKNYFEVRCWIYVSQKFQIKEIMKGIIESVDNRGCNLTLLDKLQESLQSKLRGKKFLIVLDDVWVEESGKADWEELRNTLRLSCGAKGSIIVTTTRSSTTSLLMARDVELQHEVGCLSKDHSWLLFEKCAFAPGRMGGDVGKTELEPIGKEIVEKCKGLPLAVKTLGSLMWSKRSKSDWEQVKDNIVWNLQESKVLPALKLSYDNLVPHVKRCFSYCCLFPKGYGLEKDELIPLWVSNGFIPPRGEMNLYALGEEVFDCLLWRSFFIFKVSEDSVRYVMHDLIHDMARDVMGDDCLVVESGKVTKIPNEALHFTSGCQDFQFSPQDIGKLASLRSIFLFSETCTFNQAIFESRKIHNLVYLRVLYLCSLGLRTLPDSICRIKHLRYLNLSVSSIEVLPESIIYLQNLQVLILSWCNNLCKLPKGLRYLSRLKILDTRFCSSLLYLPTGINELTSLQRLSEFHIDKKNGAKIGELGSLNLLQGELDISGLENVKDLSEAKSANLKRKDKLSVLRLFWKTKYFVGYERENFEEDENVLKELEPNSCLKELEIRDYLGMDMSPTWITNLTNLVEIGIGNCKNCVSTPSLGKLPSLRVITLWEMPSLECFHDDDTKKLGDTTNMFISLQGLYIESCPRLVSLPGQIFKNLKVLEIRFGCKLLSKRYSRSSGKEWPKISHIPLIDVSEGNVSLSRSIPLISTLQNINNKLARS